MVLIRSFGIRKILGASSRSILVKLSNEFLQLIIIAMIFAFPTACYFMNKWLQNFVYHTKIEIWVFILTAILSFLIVFLIVIFQAKKAVDDNPAESLKYERAEVYR